MSERLRIALDSNIVLSATRTGMSRLIRFWDISGVDILISPYVIDEVSRHLANADQRARFWQLLYASHLIPNGEEIALPVDVNLPAKDRPILQSAIAGKADFLITGDKSHFKTLFGRTVHGVLIEETPEFMKRYPDLFFAEGG